MKYKIIGKSGNIPFEISEKQINDCIKEHHCIEHLQLTDYLFDESKNICGLRGLADLGHGYGFDNGWQEFIIKFGETYFFIHENTAINGPSDWSRVSFKVTLQLIKSEPEFSSVNMGEWKPALGKWNDDQNYTIDDETWKTALRFAEEYHVKANHFFMATKRYNGIICSREWEKVPYIDFIKEAMTILVRECNITSDDILSVFALYGLLGDTTCTASEIVNTFGSDYADILKFLYKNKDESFREYIGRINTNKDNRWLLWIILAIQLEELRLVFCPFQSWEEDIEYYHMLENTLKFLETEECFVIIWKKLKAVLEEKKTFSLNFNKTPEELFTDWY